ncbi:choline-phosphate cytidylyltransferase B-like isoform X2 [Physella acuta]|uniref:choline-phosphate cytidylyltransferase B-like isoform X2 n=1 Tax=Physella acuta TaxID=109671 RepID=UPI0027DE24AD|nr:choline-phosphate cytidylyltransferase B-like isoform X2 [Physella acuta]
MSTPRTLRRRMATAGENGTNNTSSRKRPHAHDLSSVDREVEQIMGDSRRIKLQAMSKHKIGPAPFSHEPEAIEINAQTDYTHRITLEDANAGNVPRPVRIYADGIYDMFHTGHARQLMQAKMAFPHTYLIVGICSDEMTFKNKGRTVMNDTERYEAVRHCRYVDEVVTDAPWTLDMAFLEKHKIDFVAHDELPYTTGSADDVYKFVKERGMFLATERTEGISTTDVITRIIKDYDLYIRRNLARGYSHKDLNVSYMKAKRLKLKDNYEKLENKLKDKGKDLMDKWKDQLGKGNEMLHKWEEKSKELIGNFVEMFGRDGKLGQWFQESSLRMARAISPSSSPLPDSPSSPSTSDLDSAASPPAKRGRYSPSHIYPELPQEYTDEEDD